MRCVRNIRRDLACVPLLTLSETLLSKFDSGLYVFLSLLYALEAVVRSDTVLELLSLGDSLSQFIKVKDECSAVCALQLSDLSVQLADVCISVSLSRGHSLSSTNLALQVCRSRIVNIYNKSCCTCCNNNLLQRILQGTDRVLIESSLLEHSLNKREACLGDVASICELVELLIPGVLPYSSSLGDSGAEFVVPLHLSVVLNLRLCVLSELDCRSEVVTHVVDVSYLLVVRSNDLSEVSST